MLIAKDNLTLRACMSKMERVTRASCNTAHLCSRALKIKWAHMPSPLRVAGGISGRASFPVCALDVHCNSQIFRHHGSCQEGWDRQRSGVGSSDRERFLSSSRGLAEAVLQSYMNCFTSPHSNTTEQALLSAHCRQQELKFRHSE